MGKREARLSVNVLRDCVMTRTEALRLASYYVRLFGEICHGKGNGTAADPFEQEIRSAAHFLSLDVRDLLDVIAAYPEADRIRITRRGESIAPVAVLDDELAWLAIARNYLDRDELEVGLHDEVMAPLVAMLRSRARAREFSKDAQRVMGAA